MIGIISTAPMASVATANQIGSCGVTLLDPISMYHNYSKKWLFYYKNCHFIFAIQKQLDILWYLIKFLATSVLLSFEYMVTCLGNGI